MQQIGKVAIVTGASAGIGQASAKALHLCLLNDDELDVRRALRCATGDCDYRC
jgi:NAD(P)-dependent dehydrogenase (short-subunit alcohol dehydrogenase family)